MTLENYLVCGGFFFAAAIILWLDYESKRAATPPDDIEPAVAAATPCKLLPFNQRPQFRTHILIGEQAAGQHTLPNPVDLTLAALPPAILDHDAVAQARAYCDEILQDEIHPRCNAVEVAAGPLGANRPPDVHQACAPASATAGGEAQAIPTSYLRHAATVVMMHADELQLVDRIALLAAVGGKRCVTAFYEKGLK